MACAEAVSIFSLAKAKRAIDISINREVAPSPMRTKGGHMLKSAQNIFLVIFHVSVVQCLMLEARWQQQHVSL